MKVLAKGVAHLSFPGGGTFLPAQTRYERETLIEHIGHTARANGRVQVLIDDQRWLVHSREGGSPAPCIRCGRYIDAVCQSGAGAAMSCCVRCAFSALLDTDQPQPRGVPDPAPVL